MNEMLAKLMAKKKESSSMSPMEKKSKMDAIMGLKDSMNGLLKGNLDGAKKVTIAADSEEGLKEGLDKAEDLVEGKEDGMEAMMGMKEDESEMPMPKSEEECDKMIQHLLEKKAELKQGKMSYSDEE